jgi:hypothetical protein
MYFQGLINFQFIYVPYIHKYTYIEFINLILFIYVFCLFIIIQYIVGKNKLSKHTIGNIFISIILMFSSYVMTSR